MTYMELQTERKQVKAKEKIDKVLKKVTSVSAETAMDILAAVITVATVILVFFLDGFGFIPEDITPLYYLFGAYLLFYILHKFRLMKGEERNGDF